MAHYAELDENNVVIRVVPGVDEKEKDGEAIYREYTGTVWKRTSYNTWEGKHLKGGVPFRKNYASIGYYYDELRDAFIPPKPASMNSWVFNEETCQYTPPLPYPTDGNVYVWDENTVNWLEVSA